MEKDKDFCFLSINVKMRVTGDGSLRLGHSLNNRGGSQVLNSSAVSNPRRVTKLVTVPLSSIQH